MFDLPHLFDEQDKSGVDITVFGNNWIRSPDGYDPLKVVQEFNEHAAELTASIRNVCSVSPAPCLTIAGQY